MSLLLLLLAGCYTERPGLDVQLVVLPELDGPDVGAWRVADFELALGEPSLVPCTEEEGVARWLPKARPLVPTAQAHETTVSVEEVVVRTADLGGRVEGGTVRARVGSACALEVPLGTLAREGGPAWWVLAVADGASPVVLEGRGPERVVAPLDPPLQLDATNHHAVLELRLAVTCLLPETDAGTGIEDMARRLADAVDVSWHRP